MEQDDMHLDQETFITKLALDILEGRSFDLTGRKCSFETLFHNIQAEESDSEIEEEEEDQEAVQPQQQRMKDVEMPGKDEASGSAGPVQLPDVNQDDQFIKKLFEEINEEYIRLLAKERMRVQKFRVNMTKLAYTQAEQMLMYQKEAHLDVQCKAILVAIQNLQNRFVDVGRLKKVTNNLEKLSQMVNFSE